MYYDFSPVTTLSPLVSGESGRLQLNSVGGGLSHEELDIEHNHDPQKTISVGFHKSSFLHEHEGFIRV